jgi:hypothetical protein
MFAGRKITKHLPSPSSANMLSFASAKPAILNARIFARLDLCAFPFRACDLLSIQSKSAYFGCLRSELFAPCREGPGLRAPLIETNCVVLPDDRIAVSEVIRDFS